MTIGQRIRRSAATAKRLLNDPAGVVAFLRAALRDDGGFADRAGAGDLYYTAFALQALAALGEGPDADRVAGYLGGFAGGEGLDLVHLSCLARAWACLAPRRPPPGVAGQIRRRIEACRAADGGFAPGPGRDAGSAYGCFLAVGALEDLEAPIGNGEALAGCLAGLARGDGSYANDPALPVGSVPATAAAVAVLTRLGRPPGASAADWLAARAVPDGGFAPIPQIARADLLSTAVALHALALLGADVEPIRRPCLRFVRSLRRGDGGFAGEPAQRAADCEYTFYGLLALGHLGRK